MTQQTPTTAEVFCTLQVPAVHNWPECPIEEVDYLRVPHRHMFHIKAFKQVFHDDRDVEFIQFKSQILQYLHDTYPKYNDGYSSAVTLNLGPCSCEMVAQDLIDHFGLSSCEVNEDNENGAILTALPTASSGE